MTTIAMTRLVVVVTIIAIIAIIAIIDIRRRRSRRRLISRSGNRRVVIRGQSSSSVDTAIPQPNSHRGDLMAHHISSSTTTSLHDPLEQAHDGDLHGFTAELIGHQQRQGLAIAGQRPGLIGRQRALKGLFAIDNAADLQLIESHVVAERQAQQEPRGLATTRDDDDDG